MSPPLPDSIPASPRQRALGAVVVLAGAALLLGAALYNGYPLTFWDTRAYLEHSATLLPRPDRLIGYSIWLRGLGFGVSLWPAAGAQCLWVAWLVRRTLAAITGRRHDGAYLALIATLSLATALPWVAGQIMADVFTPLLVLALWLLLIDAALSRFERTSLLALLALCVSVHLTHLPLGLALLASGYLLLRRTGQARVLARVAPPALALLLGLAAIAGFNYVRGGKLTLAAGSNAFVLAHLVESGLASTLLNEHCPERGYLLCPYRAQLPMGTDAFLWVDKLGLEPWEKTAAISRETRRLLVDSLREHPFEQLKVAASYTCAAFFRFATGEGLDSDARYLIEPLIERFVPYDLAAYRAARQQHDRLPLGWLRRIDTPAGWLLLALGAYVLVVAAVRRASLLEPSVNFMIFVLLSLVLNATLSGNLSGVYDRYQSRLWWLLGVAVWGYWQRRRGLAR